MSKSNDRGLNRNPNDGSSDERIVSHQFLDDYIITSSASAGAWVSATYPVDIAGAR